VSLSCIIHWAEESFRDALIHAYANEHGTEIVNGEKLTEVYFRTRLDVVRRRLAAGGVRLAMALENMFSPSSLGLGATTAS
jgi:S1/P1 Nuclease.